MPRVKVPPGYRCPLCPNHVDEVFCSNSVLYFPLCNGCDAELGHFVLIPFERLPSRRQDWADRLCDLAGRSWDELRLPLLREMVARWLPEQGNRSGPWVRAMMSKQYPWSEERCLAFVDESIREIRAAISEATGGQLTE